MKKKVIIISAVSLVLLGVLGYGGYNYFNVPNVVNAHRFNPDKERNLDDKINKEQSLSDFNFLIKTLENVHPAFIDGSLDKNKYESFKNEIKNKIIDEMSIRDLKLLLSKFLCFLEDGHTRINWYSSNEVINTKIDYVDNKLCVLEDNKTYKIDKINGKDVNEFLTFIDSIYPSENNNAHASNYAYFSKIKSILNYATNSSSDEVNITYIDGTEKTYSFIKEEYNYLPNNFYYKDSSLVIDFNECYVDDNLRNIVSEINKARINGIKDFIVDARDNGGGSSTASTMILDALGMKRPKFGVLTRCSKEVSYQIGYMKSFGTYETKGSLDSKRNEDVNLYVLCNRDTFSSATMLLTYVRDGKLGTIIGEGSANKPSNYGDIYEFQLPNSKITGAISHKKFIRPDAKNNENMLVPDYVTSSNEALTKALELINK